MGIIQKKYRLNTATRNLPVSIMDSRMDAFYYFSRRIIFQKSVRSELSHKTLFCYLNGEPIQTLKISHCRNKRININNLLRGGT